jgi:hypothetical protein
MMATFLTPSREFFVINNTSISNFMCFSNPVGRDAKTVCHQKMNGEINAGSRSAGALPIPSRWSAKLSVLGMCLAA